MSRRLALLAPLALVACARENAEQPGEPIYCAIDGASEFKPVCRVERVSVDGQKVFVVHHPGGAFHRLVLGTEGRTLEAADGADQTQSALKGDRFEVILGTDRYVIPASADARSH